MLDRRRQRVDVPAHARTVHDGLLQKRLEEDLCCIILHVPLTTQSFKGLNWTELNCLQEGSLVWSWLSLSSAVYFVSWPCKKKGLSVWSIRWEWKAWSRPPRSGQACKRPLGSWKSEKNRENFSQVALAKLTDVSFSSSAVYTATSEYCCSCHCCSLAQLRKPKFSWRD